MTDIIKSKVKKIVFGTLLVGVLGLASLAGAPRAYAYTEYSAPVTSGMASFSDSVPACAFSGVAWQSASAVTPGGYELFSSAGNWGFICTDHFGDMNLESVFGSFGDGTYWYSHYTADPTSGGTLDGVWSFLRSGGVWSVGSFTDPCTNGVMDGDETGIDIGGSCLSVTFNTPLHEETLHDFDYWNITAAGVDDDFKSTVQFSQDHDLLEDCLEYPYAFDAGYSSCPNPDFRRDIGATYSFSGGTFNVIKSVRFLEGETWYARAVLVDTSSSGFVIVSSDIIEFTIGTPTTPTTPVPVSCDTFDIGCYIKQAIGWAFIPSAESLEQFTELTLEDSLPFSYIYDMGNIWNELYANSGSMTYAVSAATPLGNIDFISASAISAVPYASTIKTTLSYILYLMTAYTLYRIITKVHSPNH